MNKMGLKSKILFVLFAGFLVISAVLFNFEQILLAVISFAVSGVWAVLLIMEHKQGNI